jgi:DNA-binding transcriptional LysR family regulator
VTLEQLRYFHETARYEHVGKAARAVAISPSAVSHAVAALERELGCALFERQGKRLRLTPAGRELRDRAGRLLSDVGGLPSRIQGARARLEGLHRLGASHCLASWLLAPAWARVGRGHAGLSGDLSALRASLGLAQVLGGELDAMLCLSPLPHPELELHPLGGGPLELAVRRGHPAAGRAAWRELPRYPAAFFKSSSGVDVCETHPALLKHGLTAPVRLSFDDDAIAARFLQGTDAWALLPDFVLRAHGRALRALAPPPGFRARYGIALVCRRGRGGEAWFEALRDALRTGLGRRYSAG